MRDQNSDDALCDLIRQSLDDAKFHIGAATSLVEANNAGFAVHRLERALGSYQEAEKEFFRLKESLGTRRQNRFDAEMSEVRRRLWVIMRDLSRVAKSSILFYNLRQLRLSFVVLGGAAEEQAKAVGGQA